MEIITHQAMVAGLAKPGETILKELTPAEAHLWHMATGISGEAGEIMESVLHVLTFGGKIDITNIIEEQGDIEFYLEGYRQGFGITRASCFIHKPESPPTLSLGVVTQFTEALGIASRICVAAGEVLDWTKKLIVYRKEIPITTVAQKLGALDDQLNQFRALFRITLDQCLAANIAKLSVRYKELKYSDTSAQVRADKMP